MEYAQNKAVVGLRRFGKSSHVCVLTKDAPRVVYYDTLNDDYSEGIVCRDVTTFERFWRGVYRSRFRISLKPSSPLKYFPRFCELVWECGDLVMVVDEAHLYFRGEFCDEAFTKIITGGGHRGIELIAVTQKPKRVSDLLRSQTTWWDVFALREGKHRDYMADRLPGVDPMQLQTLERFQYLHYEDGADCYWRCKDDLRTGRMNQERIEYATQAPPVAVHASDGQHAPAQ